MDRQTDRQTGRFIESLIRGYKQADSVQKGCFSAEGINNLTATAQKHATDDAVYTALFRLTVPLFVHWHFHVYPPVYPPVYSSVRHSIGEAFS